MTVLDKAAGVEWVIAKPFTAERIAELVRDIIRHRGSTKTTAVSIVAAWIEDPL